MKASELRIGNITTLGVVYLIDQDVFRVINSEGISFKNTWANIEPIPLTEEWLLKFGFAKSNVNQLHFDIGKLTLQLPSEKEYHKNGRVYFNSWAILEECLKYVHSLQNLYFTLTGEELTFKQEEQLKRC